MPERRGPVAAAVSVTRLTRGLLVGLAGLLSLWGCGGGGSRDEQPLAAALVVGQSTEQLAVTVRSGSEVALNGENSDGIEFPIDRATWRQTDDTGIAVELVKRTDTTRAFRVPMVDVPTTLTFELEIVNTDGDVSASDVTVNVVPVQDADRFLEFFSALPGQYTVVAALEQGVTTTSPVTFEITERQVVNYADRTSSSDTPNRSDVEIGSPRTRASSWLAGTRADWSTTEEAVNAFYHPNLSFSIPRLDIDDINIQFDDTDPGAGIADHQRDTVEHFVELTLEVTSGTCTDAAGDPVDCQGVAHLYVLRADGELVSAMAGATDVQRTVSVDELKASDADFSRGKQPESAVTAAAYYAAVDPFERRTTLDDWLANAGFTDGSGQLAADADHVLYVNNYDLGFTREMFLRTDDDGDVFAYVTNFPALRPAIVRGEDPDQPDDDVIATVAMEYGPPDQNPAGEKFVKFFVYVPDRNGAQHRVNSLNFDGRGEKWIPGSCTPCHGGETQALTVDDGVPTYPGFGNIDAAFLPWDLDSFLFVDAANPRQVDPLVTEGLRLNPGYLTPEQLDRWSRPNQEDAFRRMNEAVLQTMNDLGRFGVARKQIHGWYGNDTDAGNDLPDVVYDGTYIQEGWRESEPENAGVAGLESFYHDVFARHCRICHSQAKDINQFESFGAFAAASDLIQRYVFEDGVMPNARVDMDRMWIDFHGASTPPAARIIDILDLDPDLAEGPGRPVARIKGAPIQTVLPRDAIVDIEPITGPLNVENLDGIRFDASISSFVDQFSWSLSGPAGSSAELVGADTAKPAFLVDVPGMYEVTLTAIRNLSDGSQQTDAASVSVDARALAPKAVDADGPLDITESVPDDVNTATITSGLLAWMDLDTAPANLVFRVTTPPARGTLSHLVFSQAQIDNGDVSYTEGGPGIPSAPQDSFTYSVEDDTGNTVTGQVFDINVLLRNDRPVEINNGPLSGLVEGGSKVLATADLQWDDEDDAATSIRYTLTSVPANGDLLAGATPLDVGDSFTQADVDGGSVEYRHDDSQSTSDSFEYSVTDDKIPQPVQPASAFLIEITAVADSPQIQTSNVEAFSGLERTLSGSLGTDAFGTGNVAVLDADTTDPGEIVLTLTDAPARGHLEARTPGDVRTVVQGGTFTLAEVLADDVVYVHDDGPYDATNDALTLSVGDGVVRPDPDDSAALTVLVNARTDGPMPMGDLAGSLQGYLDRACSASRSGASRSWASTPPWGSVTITSGDINFADGSDLDADDDGNPDPVPGQCGIRYRLASAPEHGVILRDGTTQIVVSTSFAGAAPNQVFTQAEIAANRISYANRTIGDGATGNNPDTAADLLDGIEFVASDCVLESPAPGGTPHEMTINRSINFHTDVGWVIDTRWTDANPTVGGCGTRGCRDCHVDTPQCLGVSSSLWWTDNHLAGGLLQSANLVNNLIPNEPTTTGHTGGQVIGPSSNPHVMLQQWAAEGRPTGGPQCQP